ncbi:A/G-specific adenine glycosylase [Pseudooctadecabacter jejudonensis]|uniref:Adenine DNA glycosylase n=1 Tax=Pseudooctadecabacter jejudonensis TaxID=1391910 RepID=A0A1Y5SDA3_9RHOB|nr:A/G-specific adenine glycosylase [Pseudooctadecabacter jejudonensis]SLN35017.1 A/G-specific adenine glycosylase [Pseudooctadecabacter jejudonensis]
MGKTSVTSALLDWYDVHAREMPWRVMPADKRAGVRPDPYAVWLSEVMLQQTTVAAVRDYHRKFTGIWPTVADLAAAEDADVMAAWAGLGYYARARNLLKCARAVVADHGGAFPQTYEGLIALPGIGPYTAAAIASIAFDVPATVLDGNVERVMARLYDEHTPLPAAKPVLMSYAEQHTSHSRPGDYAQAVMDLGATICTPKSPACGICPVRPNCDAQTAGTQLELPRKTPKKPKPTRYGTAYIARRADGAWLLETRPDKGLLGGMLGWPTTDWSDTPDPAPPMDATWDTLNEPARHTFTHFHLILSVQTAKVPQNTAPNRGAFIPEADFTPSALPTVMQKAYNLAAATLRQV